MLQEAPVTAASVAEVKPVEVVSKGVVKRGFCDGELDFIYISK